MSNKKRIINEKYCRKCGKKLVFEYVFDSYSSFNGKKNYNLYGRCPLMTFWRSLLPNLGHTERSWYDIVNGKKNLEKRIPVRG